MVSDDTIFFTDFLLASFARIMLDFLKGRKGFSMRFYISVLLCTLAGQITAAFAESATSYYYDVNNVCANKLWCNDNPGSGCCSSAGVKPNANKSGYTLRGWTTSQLNNVDENTQGFTSGKVNINASGNVTGTISTETAFYPAWAKNCFNSNYCKLVIGNDGSVTYNVQNCAEPPTGSGYNLGCENPSLNTTEQWIHITLDDGYPRIISNPDQFYCQINLNIRNCYGCFIERECNSEKFTKLTIPMRDTYKYVGHYYNNSAIIDKNGFLTSDLRQLPSEDVSIVAHWQPEQITVQYNYASCHPSSSCNSTATCNAGGIFVLPSNPSNGCVGDGYEFNSWTVGSRAYTTTSQTFTCDENLTVVANCSSTGENFGDEIVIKGFYIQ